MKKILAIVLSIMMLLSTMSVAVFAADDVIIIPNRPEGEVSTNGLTNSAFDAIWELPHYDWEKEAEGIYIGGLKVENTGYYTYTSSGEISTYGTLTKADETSYNVYADLENHKLVLNNIDLEVKAGPMPYLFNVAVAKYPHQVKSFMADGMTGVPGVLVITEGTYRTQSTSLGRYNWHSICYVAEGYNDDYEFGAMGVGIMDEENDWTVELVGENKIDVYSEFARPLDRDTNALNQDAGAYGIYAEAGLTLTGEGSLDAKVESNWGNSYNEYNTSVAGIWSEGALKVEKATIKAETSAKKQKTNISSEFETTLINPLAAVGSSKVVTIESGSVTAVNKSDNSSAIKGGEGVAVSGGTVVAKSDADFAGAGISAGSKAYIWSSETGGYVNITGGDVTAVAISSEEVIEYYANSENYSGGAPGVGIAVGANDEDAENLGISISGGKVEATGSGAGLMADSSSVSVTGGDVVVNALESGFEEGGAVVADWGEVTLAAGTYNTTLPEGYIAEGSAVVDGKVMSEDDILNWTARLGNNTYYTDEDGADKAIAAANTDLYAETNNVVWLKKSSSQGLSGLNLGDGITIYVAEGVEYTGELTGDKLYASVTAGEAVVEDGVEFIPYTYKMLVDPEYANLKVVSEGKADMYALDFGSNYHYYTANWYAEDGDTIVLLNDISLSEEDISVYDFVTVDLNGYTISSDYRYYTVYISNANSGTITFADSSEDKTGAVVNSGQGNAISNSFKKISLVFDGGNYSAAGTKSVIKTSTATITDGYFVGALEGEYTISGGTFSDAPKAEYIAHGYTTVENADGTYGIVSAAAENISVEFKLAQDNVDEGYKVYDIVIIGKDSDIINRLNTADFTFGLSDSTVNYEIIPGEDITITKDSTDRYMFNFDGKDDVYDTANMITIGQVKFTGYDEFTFKIDETAETNLVTATTYDDNIVTEFKAYAGLSVNTDTTLGDEYIGIIDTVINVPTRDLIINIDFPNVVHEKIVDQKMYIKVTGSDIDDINIALNDKDMIDGAYVVAVEDALTLNTTYNVTVYGDGYRTARYAVTMTDDKELNFWNNVKDEEAYIEEGKAKAVLNFLAGDIVSDNNINIYDLSAVVSYFASATADGDYTKYDLNRDGVIDSKDVAYVLVSWNN